MKIGGFGELENIRKAVQKDESGKSPKPAAGGAPESQATREDAVEISPRGKMMGRLAGMSDIRQEKVEDVRQRLDEGSLLSDENVREGVKNMLEELF